MQYKFTFTILLTVISLCSFCQTTPEKTDQQTDMVRKENAAKADVIILNTHPEISSPKKEEQQESSNIQKQESQERQANRLRRKMNRRRNLRRSLHTFHRRHSLIKR